MQMLVKSSAIYYGKAIYYVFLNECLKSQGLKDAVFSRFSHCP